MASINNMLLNCLDELVLDDFERFKSSLRNNMMQGFDTIPRSKLENAKQLDVVELMVDQYGPSDAANITIQILKQIRQKKLAGDLENKLEGLEGNVSGGYKKEAISHKKTKTGSQPKAAEVDEYKMSTDPRGFCLIINNMIFDPPLKSRRGSDKDEKSLKEVFKWLGFSVEVHRNQTAEQMKEILKTYGQNQHEGDCFVCCILSHGDTNKVYGTDGGIVTRHDIFSPFSGTSCKSLFNKPKVFFIQACHGSKYNPKVKVQAEVANVERKELEIDTEQNIPTDVDFFVARSTVKGFISFSNIFFGSWFIRSLCKQLRKYCPKGTDINLILTKTNEEVSRRVSEIRKNDHRRLAGQMSVYRSTLRKGLVFKPV